MVQEHFSLSQPQTAHHFLYNSPMPVRWIQCAHNDWCPLNTVKLSHGHFDGMEGVYIIWHGGEDPAVVAVGQGTLREELSAAKEDFAVQAYRSYGLYTTWAAVAARYRDGVLAYLAKHYSPKVSRPVPRVEQVPVELP